MLLIKIHNATSGEIIEREMDADELAQWEADEAESAAKAQANTKEAQAKAALLDRLGITPDEAKLLFS